MKKIAIFFFPAALILWAVTFVWANVGPSLEGAVKSAGSNTITITNKGLDDMSLQEVTFEVDDQTKLSRGVALDELKEGDQVKVEYREEGDKKVAISITKQEVPLDANDPRAKY